MAPILPLPTDARFARLIPPPNLRALFVGMTGSGKTTLARYLLGTRRYVVALDFKGLLKLPGYTVVTTLKHLVERGREFQQDPTYGQVQHLIYRPTYADMRDAAVQEQVWEWLYRRQHTTIYVDELAAVTDGNEFPYYMGAAIMRGRELGIELWSATQRPVQIPSIVLSESEYVYAFRLRLKRDRERVEELTAISKDAIKALPKQTFLFAPQDEQVIGPLMLSLS